MSGQISRAMSSGSTGHAGLLNTNADLLQADVFGVWNNAYLLVEMTVLDGCVCVCVERLVTAFGGVL